MLIQAKSLMESLSSLVEITIPTDGRLVVFGDTHGQFFDLCHMFELIGFPSATNWTLWNGDFVG
jgi:serine/threonine-protein phosphatase 5